MASAMVMDYNPGNRTREGTVPNVEVPEKDRTKEFNSKYPFIGMEVVDIEGVEPMLNRISAVLAGPRVDLAGAGLLPGMAGYEDAMAADGDAGYQLHAPGLQAGKVVY
jgi:hypothetical protein